jgi:2-aminoadipate transaminase
VELITRYKVPVAEDCAYTELRFSGERLPALKSFDTENLIIYLGSFAKTIAPGLRSSYICASPEILAKFVYATEGAYLQASTLIEMVVDKYLELYDYDEQIKRVSGLYKKRCELMMSLMDEEFPKYVKFTRPKGGMFTWIELPEGKDSRILFNECINQSVAFLPGNSFYPVDPVFNTMRLCYACAEEDKIETGMRRLGKAMRSFLGNAD